MDARYVLHLRQHARHYRLIAAGFAVFAVTELLVPPRRGGTFRSDDPRISKPYQAHEHVPNLLCLLLAVGVPTAVVFAVCVMQRKRWSRDAEPLPRPAADPLPQAAAGVFHAAMVRLWLGTAGVAAVTNVLKAAVSRRRPDFLARCEPRQGAPLVLTLEDCATDELGRLYEGLRSWPSGHSSLICCGMSFLCIWVARYWPWSRSRVPLQLACALLALAVMWSRVVDARHHPTDVLSGATAGVGAQLLVWRTVL
ncbi:AFR693Cp [Eremothecium gossypii ATCC 10895]|uniref:AFR693Cp n=1 Tax=Eremothecium gossypii (strain ATCC 10895 / CBS 109.51 / FGSC 9923 / NRRL Y-1056) TaxID=284811 RepID=Q751Y2_EREGS|nr:AFR693Cp [Eremothecium gossypii ATCC 10895]AAS54065.1 AFR693Cp [Eremothecium gossypii ATCC 10895]AEY98380.1 FAFR693Cp [Eremothecium gossypii FDAG1]